MGNRTAGLSNSLPIPVTEIGEPTSSNVVIDDLRVPVQAIPELGVDTPPWKVWKEIAGTATDYSVDFGGTITGSVPDYAALDVGNDMTIEMLLKPADLNGVLVSRDGIWEVSMASGTIEVDLNGQNFSASSSLIAEASYHVAITFTNEGSRTRVRIYLNGNLSSNVRRNTLIPAGTVGLDIAWDGATSNYDGVMDELVIYNTPLTEAQIIERYNAGNFSSTLPTGITEATDVVAWFQFNENSLTTVDNFCTLGAGQDMTLSADTGWTTGLVSTGSAGLFLARRAFSPTVRQVVHFSLQTPHGYKEGSDMDLHVHWSKKDSVAGDVCWKAYYSGAAIGGVFAVPQLLETAGGDTSTDGRHNMTILGDIDGSNLTTVSNMIDLVLWREPTDPTDTYPGDAYFNETDSHIELVMQGSRTRDVQ